MLGEPKIDLNYGKRSKKYVEERISRAKKRLSDVIADEFDLEPSTLTSFEEDYKDVIKVGNILVLNILYNLLRKSHTINRIHYLVNTVNKKCRLSVLNGCDKTHMEFNQLSKK